MSRVQCVVGCLFGYKSGGLFFPIGTGLLYLTMASFEYLRLPLAVVAVAFRVRFSGRCGHAEGNRLWPPRAALVVFDPYMSSRRTAAKFW